MIRVKKTFRAGGGGQSKWWPSSKTLTVRPLKVTARPGRTIGAEIIRAVTKCSVANENGGSGTNVFYHLLHIVSQPSRVKLLQTPKNRSIAAN